MLTKIRNAGMAAFESVDIPTSKLKLEITKILKNEGYVKNFKKINQDGRSLLRIFLKYDEADRPIIRGIEKISKPGRRVYQGYNGMPRIFNGYGTLLVSTSDGVITGKKAAEQKIGGELICSVW
jgi:small subunit ribosomal protein S8